MENLIHLSEEDVIEVRGIITEIKNQFKSVEDNDYIRQTYRFAERLPLSIRNAVKRLKREESQCDSLIIRGFKAGEFDSIKTPAHWNEVSSDLKAQELDFASTIFATLLGHIFSWRSQQHGNFVNEIIPIKGNESNQVGSSSKTALAWHNEDCFHPHRPDFLCLYCVRNNDSISTKLWSVRRLEPFKDHPLYNELFLPNYEFLVDYSHDQGIPASNVKTMEKYKAEPIILPVLWGDRNSPYMCFDPHFTRTLTKKAADALAWLEKIVSSDYSECSLQKADILFINNHKVAHGREPFNPKYDGQDRWLRRILITESIRKSIVERKEISNSQI